jgi:uncharacterized protein
MKNVFALFLGALFSIGLIISGMSDPKKVLDFLDIFGHWDASLAFVMLGAIMVAFIPFQRAQRGRLAKTLFNEAIDLPRKQQLDKNLIMGAVLFGLGWGIVGMCPAPSLTLIGLGHLQGLYFIVAMFIGIWLHSKYAGA